MKKLILIALVATMFGCTKATQDTGRALDNANSVVTEGGPKVWKGDKVWDAKNGKACECKDCEHKGKDCSCNSGCACGKDKSSCGEK
jgi:hypothetical protein